MGVYLYKVLWNWAGILLSIDAIVALLERYLGDTMERRWNWKLRVPTSVKLGFALTVLFVAQGMAYRDAQNAISQAGRDNDGLHAPINALNSQADSQKQEIERLKKALSDSKKPVIAPAIDKTGRADRFLNAEQKDHLYQELKRVSADPKQKEYITVTIAAAYPHDRESSRLAFQLIGVFQDAGWNVIGQQVPNYEQQVEGQIPIGILVSASNNMALFVESSLINSGLNADVRANRLPPGFKGVLILIGYKAGPL